MKKAAPWLLALLALGSIYPVAKVVAPRAKAEEAKAAETPKPPVAAPSEAWREPVRALREFFGLPVPADAARQPSVDELVETVQTAGYSLDLLAVLVPLPGDPRLDQALDGVQRALAESGYLIDRAWLPWSAGGDAGAPGLLLFRGPAAGETRRLAVVFLVGETPRAGLQKEALRETLDLAADLQRAAANPKLRIVGPSYSGSAESLRLTLAAWNAAGRTPLAFHIATGAATANGLEDTFREIDPAFCRTVPEDSDLHETALGFLRDHMGWDLRRAALLTEADTAYGRSLLAQEMAEASRGPHDDLLLVPFPSHISDLRNAFGEEKEDEKDAGSVEASLRSGRPALGLDLAGREGAADVVPVADPLTLRSNDLVLANLLETLSREGVRYAGILATDVRDKLFLARQIHEFSPDTVLFTLESDLLYAHPQYGEAMNGTLVLSAAPLYAEGAPWLPASTLTQGRQRRQFTSGFQQGIYEAVRYQLGTRAVPRPQVWITAVSHGSLWPVARLPLARGSARLCGPLLTPVVSRDEGDGFAGKDNLQFLLAALILVMLALWLQREALTDPVEGVPAEVIRENRWLLAAGLLFLAAAAGTLLAMSSLPLWSGGLRNAAQAAAWDPIQLAFLIAMAAVYVSLVLRAARASRRRRLGWAGALAWVLGGFVLLALLALGVRWLAVPGGQVAFFQFRARSLSSGLSPLVGLAALGGAIYAWLLNEMVRRRLMARMATDCPVVNLAEPATAGSERPLATLRELLTRTVPPGPRPWLLPAVAFLPPAALLWGTIQPVGEAKGFGRFFLILLVVALALAALSFYRFVRLWLVAHRILDRLDHASPDLATAFVTVGKELGWRPIRSFGWRIPPFRTLILSVRRLRELEAAGLIAIREYPRSVDEPLRATFENAAGEGSAAEIAGRNALERIFSQACQDLGPRVAEPAAREFLALRVAAYLRYLFAHLRSCLLGSLGPGLLALVAITSYAFQPKAFVSLAVWMGLAIAVLITGWVFVQMDRNATLSRIGETEPGQVTFDRAFLTNVFTYLGIPVLGLVATQFPEVGRLLGRLADQLLRIAGGS